MVEMNETILLWPHSSPIGRLAFNVDDVVNVTIIDDDGRCICIATKLYTEISIIQCA